MAEKAYKFRLYPNKQQEELIRNGRDSSLGIAFQRTAYHMF